jgi:molybdopterin molybdotransferase
VRVAILSTGDELAPPGSPPGPGRIFDSNRFGLIAALRDFGAETMDLGCSSDEAADVERRLDGARAADLLLTTGGVSMGERDVVKEILHSRGGIRFVTVAMRPGKPQSFGRLGEAVFFGLPGNPVSTFVVFELFVRPALRLLAGCRRILRAPLCARLEQPFSKEAGLAHFPRATVRGEGGSLTARLTGPQGSHIVRSFAEANALLHIAAGATHIPAGGEVDFYFLRDPFED